MDVLWGGHGGVWGWRFPISKPLDSRNHRHRPRSNSSTSADPAGRPGYQFPVKQAVTAGALALAGDTIAQLRDRWVKGQALTESSLSGSDALTTDDAIRGFHLYLRRMDLTWKHLLDYDWLRSLRMSSYGLLLYGPGSYAWYQFLDRFLPKPTVQNFMLKVLLNQIVLGPCVIAVVFAWNNLWQGKLSKLPEKYRKDALPTLLYGFRFWIPVSALNFWVIPLHARVAFMSTGSIFWNFFLSSTMSK